MEKNAAEGGGWMAPVKSAPVKQKTDRSHPDGIKATKIPLGRLGRRGKLRWSSIIRHLFSAI